MQFDCGTASDLDGCLERCLENVSSSYNFGTACGDWYRVGKGCVGGLSCDEASDWFAGDEAVPCQEYRNVNVPVACTSALTPISVGPGIGR